ncbi:2-hydroxyacid dehydrogenase [Salinisphaera hydrothermalis]|uniref:2-hydroxyacid dehydrogenase n=1 Tax=Salinisphaera hydrothermalis TaxID=563188 RepID=UPI00334118AC
MSSTVLVFSDSLPDDQKARLAERYTLADFSAYDDPSTAPGFDDALARARGAIGVSMRWPAETIERAPHLRVLSSVSVGVDAYDVAALSQRGIALGYTPDVLTDTTADTAMTLLLATARRVVELAEWVRAGQWTAPVGRDQFGVNVHHKRLGIVGMGRIGQAIARRAAFGFGMDVVYHNRSRKPEAEDEIGLRYVEFDELLADSDFVCVVVPGTDDTHHMFDEAAFERMAPHAIFINIARGSVVDENALVAALDAGGIRAAGLDVFQGEPIGADHPLVGRNDVVALPHIGSATFETRYDMARLAVDNLIAGLEGEPMPACYNAADLEL